MQNGKENEKKEILSEFEKISDYIMMTKDHFKVF